MYADRLVQPIEFDRARVALLPAVVVVDDEGERFKDLPGRRARYVSNVPHAPRSTVAQG